MKVARVKRSRSRFFPPAYAGAAAPEHRARSFRRQATILLSVARHMGPGIDVFARGMGPVNRQGHGARAAGDLTPDRQGHGASRSPGSWGQPVT
jgi:hypothetical protein